MAGDTTGAVPANMDKAASLSLPRAWQLALKHSHTYRAAVKNRKAAATLRAQGRARLLPHIRAGLSYSHLTGQRRQSMPLGRTVSQPLAYQSRSFYVRLRLPLLDVGRYSDYQWYLARARKGQTDWRVARHKLATRLVKRWIATLAARAKLALQRALVNSLARQTKAQQALYEQGAGRITSVRQTRTRIKTGRARLTQYKTELRVARYSLQALIGVLLQQIETLTAEPFIQNLPLKPLSKWQQRARANNPRINTKQAARKVARAAVDRYAKSQWPSIHLVGSWRRAKSGDLSTLNQRSTTYAVGLQLSIPIFSGGRQSALAAQSRARLHQASHELEATIQSVQTRVARLYQNVRNALDRIKALQASAEAGQAALEATRIGYQYGTRDNLAVLQARNELFQTREKLAQARLDLLRSFIRLRLVAGVNPDSVFRQVDVLFYSG